MNQPMSGFPAFGPPPQQPAQPAPVGWGQPPQQPGFPQAPGFQPPAMSAQQALAGFGQTPMDVRFPFLPVGFAGACEVVRIYSKPYQDGGQAVYVDVRVRGIVTPGGGQEPPPDGRGVRAWPENANPMSAQVGADHSIRIDGFGKQNTHKFAIQDFKALCKALFEDQGDFTLLPPDRQDSLALAVMTEPGRDPQLNAYLTGKVIGVQTKVVGGGPRSTTGKRKLTHLFFGPSTVAGRY